MLCCVMLCCVVLCCAMLCCAGMLCFATHFAMSHGTNDKDDRFISGNEVTNIDAVIGAEGHDNFLGADRKMVSDGVPDDLHP